MNLEKNKIEEIKEKYSQYMINIDVLKKIIENINHVKSKRSIINISELFLDTSILPIINSSLYRDSKKEEENKVIKLYDVNNMLLKKMNDNGVIGLFRKIDYNALSKKENKVLNKKIDESMNLYLSELIKKLKIIDIRLKNLSKENIEEEYFLKIIKRYHLLCFFQITKDNYFESLNSDKEKTKESIKIIQDRYDDAYIWISKKIENLNLKQYSVSENTITKFWTQISILKNNNRISFLSDLSKLSIKTDVNKKLLIKELKSSEDLLKDLIDTDRDVFDDIAKNITSSLSTYDSAKLVRKFLMINIDLVNKRNFFQCDVFNKSIVISNVNDKSLYYINKLPALLSSEIILKNLKGFMRKELKNYNSEIVRNTIIEDGHDNFKIIFSGEEEEIKRAKNYILGVVNFFNNYMSRSILNMEKLKSGDFFNQDETENKIVFVNNLKKLREDFLFNILNEINERTGKVEDTKSVRLKI